MARRFGMLDRFEDPIDAFRVRVPARSTVRVVLRPRGGDPDLFVLPPGQRSEHPGRNRGRRSRNVYVFARVHATGNDVGAAYDLTIRRAR